MQLNEQNLDGVLVVSPQARRLDASVAGAFRDRVSHCIQSGHNKVVLDLAEVQFMDSSGLTALISVLKAVSVNGGSMVISGVDSNLSSLFQLTRLNKVLRVYPSVREASQALSLDMPG